ncbi:MAG: 5'/3'-nucleotidase SurE [Spirochaetota bacterium]
MNLLLTNDDGISSEGIKALETVLQRKYSTYLIAPLKERSATSQALTIFDKMRVEKVLPGHYIVDGYPTDCVNIGLHGDIFPEIDMVISGINRGVNMGHDVHYSGTVGAARHGAIHNKYSFAISSGKVAKEETYLEEAEIFLKILQKKFHWFRQGIVYNINFPETYPEALEEICFTRLGVRTYSDTYTKTKLIGDIEDFHLGGSLLGCKITENSDFAAYDKQRISITPIVLDTTDYQELQKLQKDS